MAKTAVAYLLFLLSLPGSFSWWNVGSSRQNSLATNRISNKAQVQSCEANLRERINRRLGLQAVTFHADIVENMCGSSRSATVVIPGPQLNDNVTLKFIHIPKVAGSTIEDFGMEQGYRWGRFDQSELIEHLEQPKCWGTQYYHGIPSGVKDPSVHTFCVVRDPYARMVSEIRFELTFRVMHKVQCPSAERLNELIMEQMNQNLQARTFPCHWIPQYKYVSHCDHVLRMDKLADDLRTLGKHYGTVFELSGEHSMDDRAKLGVDCELTTSMLTPETKAALEKEYHIDAALVKMLDDNVIGNKDRLALPNKLAALEAFDKAQPWE